jgi:hypothetical protein
MRDIADIPKIPDQATRLAEVTVLGVADIDERRGILLQVQRGGKARRVLAEQIWADETASPNALVLDDYRVWVEHGGLDY